jgi:hypothetical protein
MTDTTAEAPALPTLEDTTPLEAATLIPQKEAELEALRRIAAYVPFPRAVFKPAAPPAAPAPPLETRLVNSEEELTAAEGDGFTEDHAQALEAARAAAEDEPAPDPDPEPDPPPASY